MEVAGFIAAVVMGLILGLVGGGGAILTVPILVYLFGIPPVTATGYSLFIVGFTSLVGSVAYIRRGDVNLPVVAAFALPGLAGVTLARAFLLPAIPAVIVQAAGFTLTKDILLMLIFAGLMLTASLSMIRHHKPSRGLPAKGFRRWLSVGLRGLFIGLITGLIGAGGGFIMVPALVLVVGLGMKAAVGSSLTIIAANMIFGFFATMTALHPIAWTLLLPFTALAVAGTLAGSAFAKRVPDAHLKRGFGWFVLAMGIFIVMDHAFRL